MLNKIVDNGPMPRHRNGLFWFTNDLRLHDNGALVAAAENCRRLLCIYCVDSRWFASNNYIPRRIGKYRWRFLRQSLAVLDEQLQLRGQKLHLVYGDPVQVLADMVACYDIDAVYQSAQVCSDELKQWRQLQGRFPYLEFCQQDTRTLFSESRLPFAIEHLPDRFSHFRRRVESLPIASPLPVPANLPPPISVDLAVPDLPPVVDSEPPFVHGGEVAGLAHLAEYFAADYTRSFSLSYKETRNKMDGVATSTLFSPWLAGGCLSPRRIQAELSGYETRWGASELTRWIGIELLRREYFQWSARRHANRLFAFGGVRGQKPLTSFYGQRFTRWCLGNTPWPLVNACMNQLNATGYLSNRGRKIAASCLVNELQVDWRAGAYYFEMQLIDYDAASNWGNWQHLAGVGADPRGSRHFSMDSQSGIYDPDGTFVRKWRGQQGDFPIDTVDASDWPVRPDPAPVGV